MLDMCGTGDMEKNNKQNVIFCMTVIILKNPYVVYLHPPVFNLKSYSSKIIWFDLNFLY
jgi:hypothetical protein